MVVDKVWKTEDMLGIKLQEIINNIFFLNVVW